MCWLRPAGHPERPAIPNAHLGMVSDDIFPMDRLPDSILIVGGAFIACEMACNLAGFRCEGDPVCQGPQILRGLR